jgi:hypothetical protein
VLPFARANGNICSSFSSSEIVTILKVCLFHRLASWDINFLLPGGSSIIFFLSSRSSIIAINYCV